MKKIFGLTVAALMVMGLIGGGTWAYFSDIETSSGNTLTAGTMNLTVDVSDGGGAITGTVTDGDDGVNEYITFPTDLAPGDSGNVTFKVTAAGNVAGTLTITCNVTTTENGENEPEASAISPANNGGGDGDLDAFVGVKLTKSVNGAAVTYPLGSASYYDELEGLQAALNGESGVSVPAGQYIDYVIHWDIDTDIVTSGGDGTFGDGGELAADDNVIQSDTATIDITFTMNQTP
ncbi:TasA family protein [Chloroflexota bacterium]